MSVLVLSAVFSMLIKITQEPLVGRWVLLIEMCIQLSVGAVIYCVSSETLSHSCYRFPGDHSPLTVEKLEKLPLALGLHLYW